MAAGFTYNLNPSQVQEEICDVQTLHHKRGAYKLDCTGLTVGTTKEMILQNNPVRFGRKRKKPYFYNLINNKYQNFIAMQFNHFAWNNYLQTDRGKKAVNDFSLLEEEPQELDLTFRYNDRMRMFFDNETEREALSGILNDYWEFVIGNREAPQSMEEAKMVYEEVISDGLTIENEVLVEKGDYQFALGTNTWITWLLYQLAPDYFFPNLIQFKAYNLYKTADTFDIELPAIPKKSDYRARCMYYWQLCETFHKFRADNNLTPPELCAFLYDYAPNFFPKNDTEMPQPSRVWMIGGVIDKNELFDVTFWQGNQEARRGDIIVHYETSPVSAITCIWQAATDGLIDPFFHYYGCTYITNRIEVPHLKLADLKSDVYFAQHPLVRKNLQGVNGWPLSSADYDRLLEMWRQKGTDTDKLPKLYAPTLEQRSDIKIEEDVEDLLLVPLLQSMGFSDYKRRLPIKAGRGHRIIPDYALHYCDTNNEESAKVLIEAKYHMKNPQETEAAFLQARSYARLLNSSVIVLCDKNFLQVYERINEFDRQHYLKFYWSELSDPDKFNRLKKLLA